MDLARLMSAVSEMEQRNGIHVYFLAESGSRAWGYANPDSDYDFTFAYIDNPWARDVSNTKNTIRENINVGDAECDFQGFALPRLFYMAAYSDPKLYEVLKGASYYARHPQLDALMVVADHYLSVNKVCGAWWEQVQRDLFPPKGCTSKHVIRGMRYAMMAIALEANETVFNLDDDRFYPGPFGTKDEVRETIQWLRSNPDASVFDLGQYQPLRKLREQYDLHLERRPWSKNIDLSFSQHHFNAVSKRLHIELLAEESGLQWAIPVEHNILHTGSM